jgi:hypothetical protein
MSWAEHSVEIEAPIETSFDAIVDYESFPRWQDAVDSVEVASRTADGLGEDVHLFVDAKVRKIDYVLRYSYTRPTEIRWDFVEGNGMRDVDGVYTLESLGPDRTRATYKLGADPEIPVPGMILRRTHRQLVKRSVEDLKTEAERRHRTGESTATPPVAPAASGGEAPHEDVDIGAGSPYDELAAAAAARPEAGGGPATSEAGAENAADARGAADDWVPMAERVRASQGGSTAGSGSGPGSGAPRPGRSGGGSPSDVAGDLADRVLGIGRDVAEGAIRAGQEAAGESIRIATRVVRRINRKLGRDQR